MAECSECARLRHAIAAALAIVRRGAGGTVAAVRAVLEGAFHHG